MKHSKKEWRRPMKADLYEKYYKLGFNHYMFKNIFGLHKPDKAIKRFYYGIIVLMLILGTVVF